MSRQARDDDQTRLGMTGPRRKARTVQALAAKLPGLAIEAKVAPVARIRSSGASSTSRPRWPALQNTVSNPRSGGVDDHRQDLALGYRRDAADDVAGRPFGGSGLGHLGLLAADGFGQRLEVELPRSPGPRPRQLAVHAHDQRLEHPLGWHAHRDGGFNAVLAAR